MAEERRMAEEVRTGEASGTATCLYCDNTFEASRWQPRMRCPHCDTIGYPDTAGYNLIPLRWLCLHCEHENDGTTNFCVNCGEGLTSRCPRCEAAVYGAACMECGALEEPLVRRNAMLHQREQRFRPIRTHVIVQTVQQTAEKPTAKHDPRYGVAGWKPIIAAAEAPPPAEPEVKAAPPPPTNATTAAGGARPATAQAPKATPAQPQKPQKKKRRLPPNLGWGVLWILAGLLLLFWEPIQTFLAEENLESVLGSITLWLDEQANPLVQAAIGVEATSPAFWVPLATVVVGLFLLPTILRALRQASQRIFP